MPKNPTKKQRELLNFIDTFISEHGYSPSYREVMNLLDYKSVSTVATHVDNLIVLGFLRKVDHSARSLEVIGGSSVAASPDNPDILPSQEKWLIDIISNKFKGISSSKKPTQKEIDDLSVLVGALHVLGLTEASESFKTKLKHYR